jgi:hypothetical protein
MAKSASTISVTGTNGDDILHIPAGYDITQVTVNGGRGNDTLDLSTYQAGTTPGVYVDIEASGTRSPGSIVSDQSFSGVPGSLPNTGHTVQGTITNVENLIGTTGNDVLSMNLAGITTRLDGGAGNDYLSVSGAASATLIGGSGSDWLISTVAGSTLIGGSVDSSGVVHEDGSVDTFQIGLPQVTIDDFQVGTDRLIFGTNHSMDAAFAAATWVDNGSGGSTLMVNGAARVTLAGIPVSTAQTIGYGFEYVSTGNGTVQGGATNDVLNCSNNYVETVMTGPSTGNDLVLHFNPSQDLLDFTSDAQVSWSNTFVNGEESLLGTFAGGSVTLMGLTTADVGSLHVQGLVTPPTIDPTDHMSWWSVPSDAALL